MPSRRRRRARNTAAAWPPRRSPAAHAPLALAPFALWPLSRLVHAFTAPVGYLTRQRVPFSGGRPGPRMPETWAMSCWG
ncbi:MULTISPECIES: respiratory nitrate reductase subunit gamma [unclassified Streptomyces]|uniref:respiratory nitrate reductase subunit gamma n=1 Tax=unclassified Streptomyces TaxID=2593676 RepID=UPI001BE88742|nr:respiratory nitrate reductase subunit gamma [Streptomyces sp. ISL-21]MBT2613516.1 respiratory nitrate reductase subunit gamma [Streptomyces sp. ISL-87]